MYRPSNVILSVQRLFESNVIRVWNENVLANRDLAEGELRRTPSDERSLD